MAIRTFQRREVKFLLSKAQYDALQPVLLTYMHPDKYCVDGKEYGVYNIYYDTDDNFLIRESLEKPCRTGGYGFSGDQEEDRRHCDEAPGDHDPAAGHCLYRDPGQTSV